MPSPKMVEELRTGRPSKSPIFMFNGVRFYKKPSGYYKSDYKHGGQYLHRAVWQETHGPIAGGMHVHHKNADKSDNRLENLECLSASDHQKGHWLKDRNKKLEASRKTIPKAIAAAAQKRKSMDKEELSSMHRAAALKGVDRAKNTIAASTVERICAGCGNPVRRPTAYDRWHKAFCEGATNRNRCQQRHRRMPQGTVYIGVCSLCKDNASFVVGSGIQTCEKCSD